MFANAKKLASDSETERQLPQANETGSLTWDL